jgi:hypothetical protein
VLAVQESVTEVKVMPEACKLVGTLGGVVSGRGRVVTFKEDTGSE